MESCETESGKPHADLGRWHKIHVWLVSVTRPKVHWNRERHNLFFGITHNSSAITVDVDIVTGMVANGSIQHVLPKDLMAMQLGQIDLLMAMYAPDDAVSIEASSLALVEILRAWCDGDDDAIPNIVDSSIDILLNLDLNDADSLAQDEPRPLQLSLTIPLKYHSQLEMDPPAIKARLQQPAWMSKTQVAQLNMDLPEEDILTIIEHVKEAALTYSAQSNQTPAEANGLFDKSAPLVRAWFYFPSISTRAKRDDLINFAPTYGLTGFLMAGKPGILCLEGGSTAIDIPSQHKKVSERYRQTDADLVRVFGGMEEITETVGERRGERANRSDMKALELWLVERGLGAAFGNVFM
jgi:hypothetical protein